MILGSGGGGNSHLNIGESSSSKLPRVSTCPLKNVDFFTLENLMMLSSSYLMQTEWSPCHDDQESSNVSSSGSRLVYMAFKIHVS